MNKDEKFWNRVSKYHDTVAKDSNFEKTLSAVKKYVKPNFIVLDYGCATGLYSISLAKLVKEVHGIDISTEMIKQAKKKSLSNTIFTKASIYEKYKPKSFNMILAFNILHLVEEDSLKRINELLKPGGVFISVTPCLGEKLTFLGLIALLMKKLRIISFVKKFTFLKLNNLISDYFDIIEEKKIESLQYLIVAKKEVNRNGTP